MLSAPRPLIQIAWACAAPRPVDRAQRPTVMARAPTEHAATPCARLIHIAALPLGTSTASIWLTPPALLSHQCNAVSPAKAAARHCIPPPAVKTRRAALWCAVSIRAAAPVRGINSAWIWQSGIALDARWHVQPKPPLNQKHAARATMIHAKAPGKLPRRCRSAAAHAGNSMEPLLREYGMAIAISIRSTFLMQMATAWLAPPCTWHPLFQLLRSWSPLRAL